MQRLTFLAKVCVRGACTRRTRKSPSLATPGAQCGPAKTLAVLGAEGQQQMGSYKNREARLRVAIFGYMAVKKAMEDLSQNWLLDVNLFSVSGVISQRASNLNTHTNTHEHTHTHTHMFCLHTLLYGPPHGSLVCCSKKSWTSTAGGSVFSVLREVLGELANESANRLDHVDFQARSYISMNSQNPYLGAKPGHGIASRERCAKTRNNSCRQVSSRLHVSNCQNARHGKGKMAHARQVSEPLSTSRKCGDKWADKLRQGRSQQSLCHTAQFALSILPQAFCPHVINHKVFLFPWQQGFSGSSGRSSKQEPSSNVGMFVLRILTRFPKKTVKHALFSMFWEAR